MTTTDETSALVKDEARELTASEMEAIHGGKGQKGEFLMYTLTDVIISSYH